MKIFGLIASLFGSTSQAAETKMVDPKSILFSTPTLNDALPAFSSGSAAGQNFFQTHEDNWRQFEAVSASFATQIDQELGAIRTIHETASVKTKMGTKDFTAFRRVHIRKLILNPLQSGPRLSELAALADKRDEFDGVSLSGSPAVVGGYAFSLGHLVVFGQADGDRLLTLCFFNDGAPGLSAEKADRLVALLEKHHLIVVHWASATKLDGVNQFAGFLRKPEGGASSDSKGQVRQTFEHELLQRGFKFTIDPESGRYRLKISGFDTMVSIENLQREVDRDHDLSRVSRFVDTISTPVHPDTRAFDIARVYWCLEPSDYVEKADYRKSVSDRVDRVLVLLSEDSTLITWITPKMLEAAGISLETAALAGFENLSRELKRAKIEFKEMDGVRLGYVNTELPFKASLMLAPNLKDCVEATLGWPLQGVAPDRNFLYLWAARHDKFVGRVGGVVVEEYAKAGYPLSTEVYSIDGNGVHAIGAFPVEAKRTP